MTVSASSRPQQVTPSASFHVILYRYSRSVMKMSAPMVSATSAASASAVRRAAASAGSSSL